MRFIYKKNLYLSLFADDEAKINLRVQFGLEE